MVLLFVDFDFFFAIVIPLVFAKVNSKQRHYTESCCDLNGLFIIFHINVFFIEFCYHGAVNNWRVNAKYQS